MEKFDWYQATFHGVELDQFIRHFERKADLAIMRPCRAKNGYETGVEFVRNESTLLQVWWGGNPGVHVIATGENAIDVSTWCREFGPHRITRLDSRLDFITPGLFDALTDGLRAYAKEHGIAINMQGDWERGKARTLYLGSRKSTVQLVVYEKGYETGGDLNWVRVEVRVFPKGREKGELVSTWNPSDAFSASRWLCEALESQGWHSLTPRSIGTVWKPSDDLRARRTMLKQYGAIIRNWANEVGGFQGLGDAMTDELNRMDLEKRLIKGDQDAVNPYLELLATDQVQAVEAQPIC